jgi:hypothetical protein
MHRAIAEKLRSTPQLLERARARLQEWELHGGSHPYYVAGWREVLSRSAEEVASFLVDPGEHARALRQVTPFARALDARERWQIWRKVAP